MLRPVPTLEMPTLNAFGDLFKGCDFAVRESAEDLEAIMRRIELDNQHSRVDRAQAPVSEVAPYVVMTQWGASDGEDDSPLIVKKRKRTVMTAKVSDEKETAQVQAETEQGVKQTTLCERTTKQTKPTTKSLMAPKVPTPRTHPSIVAVYETQIVPLPETNAEIAPNEDKGKNFIDQQKGEFSYLAFLLLSGELNSYELICIWSQPRYSDQEMEMIGSTLGVNPSAGYSSSAFDLVIEMVRSVSAPTAEEKMADMEGSASSPMDTEIAPKPFVTADGKTFRTPDKARDVIFKVPNDEEEEMKNEDGVKSLGSAANRSLQGLLELDDLPESSSVSTEVEVAKEVLAI
ncbi:Hypothetical predicted protein [Prunus dulcis]|uniref:Uncharacterized protein n=1 Tax=Prunus dulcis TaxID=3755 RepID=A0A5E4FWZ4_PRUDU|nr:Hypothetical predicted protein [Prunus dulcis]